MEESSNSIVESRQELMISPTTPTNPTLRTGHFLKPSLDSNSQSISSISLPSLAFPPTFDPQNWPLTVNFLGWKNPPTNWKEWVHQMSSSYAPTWKKAGIYDAIFNSTCRINKHEELLLGVAERWCPDTNSFIFPWGEATVTLEDMLIAGYSVVGSPVFEIMETEESRAIQEALVREKRDMNRTPAKKALQSTWLKIFMDSGSEIEHEAFLSLWLSRFVFPTSRDVICGSVFPIAIQLARGNRIALAPAVLASIYRDLSLLNEKIVSLTALDADADEKLVATTYAPFQLVLVWMWERFVKLSPERNLIKVGEPRFAQWNNVKCNTKDLRLLLDLSKESFNWRPYSKPLENWHFPKFYREKEMLVSPDSGVDDEILSLIMCLRVSELVGLESECIEQYLPQRVARQFGFDQDLPGLVDQRSATSENAWDCYIRSVTGMECYIPSRVCEGDATTRYLEWWNHSVSLQPQEKAIERTPKVPKEKEMGQELFGSSAISSKSRKRKRSTGELNVSKVAAKSSNRMKKGEASKSPIRKKAAGELKRLEVSAEGSEIMKKGEASNSAIRKKAKCKFMGLKVSAESMKKCGTSKSSTRKKSAGELNGLKVSAESSERMKKGETSNSPKIKTGGESISSLKITTETTKENINGEASVGDVNQANKSEIFAESSKIMNKETNKPAISLAIELNEFQSPPGFPAKNDAVKADENITIAEMMKCEKMLNDDEAGNKQCTRGNKLAGKLDSHFSQVAANELAKTSAIENEKDGSNKTAFSQSKSYSSSPADNESLKGCYEVKLKQNEACEIKQTRSNGNVSDISHQSQSHLSANERSLNKDDTGNKAAQLGKFHSNSESEPLKVSEPAPPMETLMLSEATKYLENVDLGDSVSSANNKALEVVKSATSMEEVDLSIEAEESQDLDIELDESESHSSSVAGNESPKSSDLPEKVKFSDTGSLTDNDSSRGNVGHNGNKGSNEYSNDAPKVTPLEARIERLGKIMAAGFRDICG